MLKYKALTTFLFLSAPSQVALITIDQSTILSSDNSDRTLDCLKSAQVIALSFPGCVLMLGAPRASEALYYYFQRESIVVSFFSLT